MTGYPTMSLIYTHLRMNYLLENWQFRPTTLLNHPIAQPLAMGVTWVHISEHPES